MLKRYPCVELFVLINEIPFDFEEELKEFKELYCAVEKYMDGDKYG